MATKKTPHDRADVKSLVEEVLATLPEPYTEDVTDDVFCAIERNPRWHRDYEDLCASLTRRVVNQRIGRLNKELLSRTPFQRTRKRTSRLIGSYTKLR